MREKSGIISERHLLATLCKGSCFNFNNAFMGRPSLFDFEAESDVNLCTISQDDFSELIARNKELLQVKQIIRTQGLEEVLKYDYQRMVYTSINQLVRAQKQASNYVSYDIIKVLTDTKKYSEYESNLKKVQSKSVFGVGGHKHKINSFLKVIRKVKRSTFRLLFVGFHIRNVKIFKLVDYFFDKFSGFTMNLDLAVMLHYG